MDKHDLKSFFVFLLISILYLGGCARHETEPKSERANPTYELAGLYPHPKWFSANPMHGKLFLQSNQSCTNCHGANLAGYPTHGAQKIPSCTQCHAGFPHTERWKKSYEHGLEYFKNRESCKTCHGSDLKGGDTGVACTKCHSYPHDNRWAQPENHGAAFLKLVEAEHLQEQASGVPQPDSYIPEYKECMGCHGNSNGFADRNSKQTVSCSSCHSDMPHRQQFHGEPGNQNRDHEDYVAANPEKEASCFTCHANPQRHSPLIGDRCISCHKKNPPFKYKLTSATPPFPSMGTIAPSNIDSAKEINTAGLTLDWETVYTRSLEPACFRCHNDRKAKRDINVQNYETAFKDLAALGRSVEEGGSMPKDGDFTDLQRCLITEWVKAGGPRQSSVQPICKSKGSAGEATDGASETSATIEEEVLARGKYLFRISACSGCHSSDSNISPKDPQNPLGGGYEFRSKYGAFYVPNISPSIPYGIGKWTPKDFLRAMRDGISPKHEYYYPLFPYQNYSKMSDEDILAIYRYLMTLPPVELPNREHDLKLEYRYRNILFGWRLLNFDNPVLSPLLSKGPMLYEITKSDSWNRGAYLVEGPMHCTQCHTPRDPLDGLLSGPWLSGSVVAGGDLPGPNLTPDLETGLGHWTRDDWLKFMSEGKTPRGDKVSGEMWPFVKDVLATLSKRDKLAVAEYLMSLKPIKNVSLQEIIKKKKSE
jgi:mono/diheme cytochrome c family protein